MSLSSTLLGERWDSHEVPERPVASTRNLQLYPNLLSWQANSKSHFSLFRLGLINMREPARTRAPAVSALSDSIRSKETRSICQPGPWGPKKKSLTWAAAPPQMDTI